MAALSSSPPIEARRRAVRAHRLAHARGHLVGDAAGHVSATGLTPKPPIEVSSYQSKRLFATARDGTQVPYVVIHKKGLKLDGSTPAWISAYGSYGRAGLHAGALPAARSLAWPMRASSSATPTCAAAASTGATGTRRGSSQNKPNTWRDLIDVCLDLCAKRYTAPARLAIGGRSRRRHHRGPRAQRTTGPVRRRHRRGRLVKSAALRGRAERLRRGTGVGQDQRGAPATGPSRGSTATRRVQPGVAYPAVLLTTGVTDPRVAPFHVAKMTGATAGLQQLRQAHPAARRLRRGPRRRLNACPAGSRGGRHLRVPAVADGRQGLPARLSRSAGGTGGAMPRAAPLHPKTSLALTAARLTGSSATSRGGGA